MEAPKTLRRPANWQDFETLTKKLWGEIWNCPEIKRNGRSGQEQHGVDVYGIPAGESAYFGIQCKGKEEYANKQFTEAEIVEEIEKAKLFKPALRKLYFATTAVKDVKIEQFVREKNLENRALGIFEVHLYSWEDIVELIDENQQTHDWYVKSQNYKTKKSVKVTFNDNSVELTATVPFRQVVTEYKQKAIPANPSLNQILMPSSFMRIAGVQLNAMGFSSSKVNNSYFRFYLKAHNTGPAPIEDFKIFLRFEGDFQELDTVTRGGGIFPSVQIDVHHQYDTFIDSANKTGRIVPLQSILVSDDVISFDDIKIKPIHKTTTLVIHWKLVSKDFKDEGKLLITLKPDIKREYTTVLVEDPLQVRVVEGAVEDYITDRKETE